MPKKGRIPQELWETYRAMSVDVGRIKDFKFLAQTACMNVDERKMIGFIEVAKKLFKGDKAFVAFLDKFAKPFFEYLGRAKWDRDVVTDLGFALANRQSRRKDVSKLLAYKPPKG